MKQIHIQGLLLGGLAILLLARPSPAEGNTLPEPASATPLSSNQQDRQQGEPPQALTQIGRAHWNSSHTDSSRMPSSA